MVVYELGRRDVKGFPYLRSGINEKVYREFENSKTNIEVWSLSNTGKIEDDFVIEVSFKTNEESIAKRKKRIINEEFRPKRMVVTER